MVQGISDEATLKSCPKEVQETALQRIGRRGFKAEGRIPAKVLGQGAWLCPRKKEVTYEAGAG